MPARPPAAPSKKAEALRGPIDLNRAPAEELQKLPGVGPRLARRILEERAKAPFQAVEELRRVSGIGAKTLEKLRPYVTVRPAATPGAGGASAGPPADAPGLQPRGGGRE